MNEDADLLKRYVEGRSQAAFAALVRRRIGLVYAIAWRRTRDAHSAEDITQTVFTALAKKAPQLVGHPTLVGWLYRSAHFAASDAVRAARRRQRGEAEALLMQQLEREAAGPDWHTLSPVVDEALSEMAAVDRDAVLLRVMDDRSYGEIGRNLGIGESGARMRVERALEKLRHALARRGITSTTTALALAIGQQAEASVPPALASAVATTAIAATSVGGVSTLLNLMSSTKVITALSIVALAGVTGTALYRARQAQDEVISISRERDRLAARLEMQRGLLARADRNAAEQLAEISKIEAVLAAANDRLAATAPRKPGSASATGGIPGNGSNLGEEARLAAVAREVAGRDARDKVSPTRVPMAALDTTYQALYRQLNLSADQVAAFKTLATENAQRHAEIDQLAAARGLKVSDPSLVSLYGQADADFDAGLSGIVGTSGHLALKHFAETYWIRSATDTLAGALFYSDAPLTANQANQLVEIVWDNMRTPTGEHHPAAANFDAMAIQAQGILSETQLVLWRRLTATWKSNAKK